MGAIAHSAPNYPAVQRSLGINPGPVITQNFVSLPLYLKVNGVMNMVFAYSGAMIFPEIMAEMKRPMDFWKNLALVQTIILTAYLIYGCFIYVHNAEDVSQKYQGQFSLPLAYQGVSAYVWQTAGNGLSIVVGMIAAGLYGNIAIKTIYTNVIEDMLKGPRLLSPKGRIVWAGIDRGHLLGDWSVFNPLCRVRPSNRFITAFVIGSAIPQIQTVIGLLSAIAIMQFSYTFPPLLWFGYQVMTDAMSADKAYVPCNDTNRQKDTWSDWSRWRRGLFGGRWYLKGFNLALGLAGIATACLGMWGAGEAMKATFAITGATTSFGCTAPV
ncbi:hypothetical protein APHAL10511_000539 [Amanita phalloides]|nr:hypothetical protein APHAL10511_000539 [Amanita phalloides]